jgi:hypothetical protein
VVTFRFRPAAAASVASSRRSSSGDNPLGGAGEVMARRMSRPGSMRT